MILQKSMLNWRMGGVNLQWIYVHCAIYIYIYIYIYICNVFGALVFQRSMLDLREGAVVNMPWVDMHCAISAKIGVAVFKASMLNCRGSTAIGICAFCHILKHIWCTGFPEIYAQLEEGVGSICNGYMYIVLYIYMKCMWCNGFPEICA